MSNKNPKYAAITFQTRSHTNLLQAHTFTADSIIDFSGRRCALYTQCERVVSRAHKSTTFYIQDLLIYTFRL